MLGELKTFAKTHFPFLVPVWRRISAKSPVQIFTEIYQQRRWGDEESVSGPGSSVEESASVRAALPLLIKELGASSLLDVPCGDFFWMRMVDLDIPTNHTILPSEDLPQLTINHEVAADLDSSNAFEGPEKLLEVWFAPSADACCLAGCGVGLALAFRALAWLPSRGVWRPVHR